MNARKLVLEDCSQEYTIANVRANYLGCPCLVFASRYPVAGRLSESHDPVSRSIARVTRHCLIERV